MSVLSDQPKASFDKIEFPFTDRDASCEYRRFTHEFLEQDSGAQEKMGRKIWVFSFECEMHETMQAYPNLYSIGLPSLRTKFEKGVTAELVVPEIGTVRAFITKWQQKRRGKILSGEHLSLTFEEDDLQPFTRASAASSRDSFVDAAASYLLVAKSAREQAPASFAIEKEKRKPQASLFDLLDDAITLVASVQDQAELYGNVFAAKLAKVTALCKTIHSTVRFLRDPQFASLAREVRRLWDAATALKTDLHRKGPPLIPYIVPFTMSVGGIAKSYYGDARRGGEILSLNAIKDPFAVAAGTLLNIYQRAA